MLVSNKVTFACKQLADKNSAQCLDYREMYIIVKAIALLKSHIACASLIVLAPYGVIQ